MAEVKSIAGEISTTVSAPKARKYAVDCLEVLKTDFRLGIKLNFNRTDWRDFMCKSYFSCISEQVQLCIRIIAALSYTSVLVVGWVVNGLNDNALGFLAYLTNWGLIIGSLGLWLLTYVSFVGLYTTHPRGELSSRVDMLERSRIPLDSGKSKWKFFPQSEETRLKLARICWALQSISLGLALMISIMFFLFLSRYNYPPILLLAHIFNSATLIFVFLIARIPFPFSHFLFIYPVILCYIGLTVIIYITHAVIDGHEGYVYEPIDIAAHPVSASLIISLGSILSPFIVHALIHGILGILKNKPLYEGELLSLPNHETFRPQNTKFPVMAEV